MIDIYKHIRSLFPWIWQNNINLNLTDTIILPCFDVVNVQFSQLKEKTAKKLGYSAQRLSLEEGLNDEFDDSLRRITVINGPVVGDLFFYEESEAITTEQESFIYESGEILPETVEEIYIYETYETGGSTSEGFTVNVPAEYLELNSKIVAFIENVKILGTFYTIVYF